MDNRIKDLREDRDLTQTQVAKATENTLTKTEIQSNVAVMNVTI